MARQDVECPSDIDAENNARCGRAFIHRAAPKRAYGHDDEHAENGEHHPRDNDTVNDRVPLPRIHVPNAIALISRLPSALWRISADALW